MKLNYSSFLMFTIHSKALKCFSLAKQVMNTIPEECKYAVTQLCQHSNTSEMKTRVQNNQRHNIIGGNSSAVLALKRNYFDTNDFGNAITMTKVKLSYLIFDWVINKASQKRSGLLPPLCFCFYLFF